MAKYKIEINQIWSEEVVVNAKNATEAKKKLGKSGRLKRITINYL